MNQFKYQAINQKELHDYVLAHREDQEAFHAYIDKLHADGNWIEMPPLESEQELENYPDFLEHIRNSSNPRDNAV